MKIAVVLNTSWNILNFRAGLVKKLKDYGHEVFAIAPYDNYSPLLVQMGCKYIEVKMDSRGINPIKDIALTFELYKIYKKIKPDLILHYTIKPNIYGTLAANFLKIPVVNNVCGLGTAFMSNNFITKIALSLYKLSFKYSNKVFFQNQFDKDFFINKKLVSKEKVDVLPGSGIDLNKFRPTNNRPNDKFTFLVISRLIYDKGILEYIDAIKKLKSEGIDARFQLLGPSDPQHRRGIPIKEVEKWVQQDSLEYLGTTEDVRFYLEKADCVVLPSYREGTPRTLLEAASCAKPIVTTDVPGCNNVVLNGKNGYLCKMKDSLDLAEKMQMVYDLNPKELKMMGRRSRETAENYFDEKLVIDKYLETISEIKNLS